MLDRLPPRARWPQHRNDLDQLLRDEVVDLARVGLLDSNVFSHERTREQRHVSEEAYEIEVEHRPQEPRFAFDGVSSRVCSFWKLMSSMC
jgi:hypothetical protein